MARGAIVPNRFTADRVAAWRRGRVDARGIAAMTTTTTPKTTTTTKTVG